MSRETTFEHPDHAAALQAARGYLEASELGGMYEEDRFRTLTVETPVFKRYNHRQAVFHLDHKPEVLGAGGTSQRTWQSYSPYPRSLNLKHPSRSRPPVPFPATPRGPQHLPGATIAPR